MIIENVYCNYGHKEDKIHNNCDYNGKCGNGCNDDDVGMI